MEMNGKTCSLTTAAVKNEALTLDFKHEIESSVLLSPPIRCYRKDFKLFGSWKYDLKINKYDKNQNNSGNSFPHCFSNDF